MDNLKLYNSVRAVPVTALKKIEAGRLKGKSDINPVWRIKVLTEQFGICGFGWKYEIVDKRLEKGCKDEISAFVDINLYVKVGEVWSAAIPGTGGSSFVANESKGLYQSDECFKMALTDAISVACKVLGIGADVYWEADKTKYDNKTETPKQTAQVTPIISASSTTEKPEEKKDLQKEIGSMLVKMYGKEEAPKKLVDFTRFTIGDKEVAGVSRLELLKDKRLQTTYGKIKKVYEDWCKEQQKAS